MYEIRLDDKDRERLGCDEWLPWDLWAVTIGDLDELAERFNFDPDDWPTPFFGELTLEQAGDPDAKPKAPKWQFRAGIWLALRQAGVEVSWADMAKVRHLKARTRRTEEPGKEDPATEPSTTQPSTTSTE